MAISRAKGVDNLNKAEKEKLKTRIMELLVVPDTEHTAYLINGTIQDVINIIDMLEIADIGTHINSLVTLKDKVKLWWDEIYPEDIFPVHNENVAEEDRDKGVLRVAEIRDLIKKIESGG